MVDFFMCLAKSIKPIVMLIRGGGIGIGFTMVSHSTFAYCSPEARFMTPFMKSAQSPEGTSTYLFPKQFGTRLANSILLGDQWISAI